VELQNSFTVPTSVDEAWAVLLDIPRVAPCMPGAVLDGAVDDSTYQGRVKVKLGPIAMTYRGTVTLDEVDEAARRISLTAKGRELRGAGTANATATATLTEAAAGTTEVVVVTSLDLTGRPAQFGRGVLNDVSEKLIGQFAANLAAEISGTSADPGPAAAAPAAAVNTAAARPTAPAGTREPEALDLMSVAGGPMLRIGAAAGGAVLALLLVLLGVRSVRRR
jgi:carbon monoxide dehydrogenase subunit G